MISLAEEAIFDCTKIELKLERIMISMTTAITVTMSST